jgi:hypothetical protein
MKYFIGILLFSILLIWYYIYNDSQFRYERNIIRGVIAQCRTIPFAYHAYTKKIPQSCEQALKEVNKYGINSKDELKTLMKFANMTELICEDKTFIINIELKSGKRFHYDPRAIYPQRSEGRGDYGIVYPTGFYKSKNIKCTL